MCWMSARDGSNRPQILLPAQGYCLSARALLFELQYTDQTLSSMEATSWTLFRNGTKEISTFII